MARRERQSNIELLRILSIMGIIVLHYNNPVIGRGITYAKEGGLNFYILYVLESVFACGVDLFMLISGYFMCLSKKRNLWKPVELIVQVMLFREAIYLVKILLHSATFSVKTAVSTLVPANYFVILYCAVYLLSPFVSVLLDGLTVKNFRTLIILSLVLFSLYPTVVDVLGELRHSEYIGLSSVGMYGSQWGYTLVHFMLMYLIGAWLRRGDSRLHTTKTWKLAVALCADVIVLVIWARINDKVGYFTERTSWSYCNPLIIIAAILAFLLFNRIDLGVNKRINALAEAAFSVFLLHSLFIPYLWIEKFVTSNTLVMLIHILACVVVIYFVCWVVHVAYHKLMDPIFKWLSSRIALPVLDVES